MNNLVNGTRTVWYESGSIKFQAQYANGKPDGTARYFNDGGKLRYELTYKEGEVAEVVTGWLRYKLDSYRDVVQFFER